MQGTLHSTVFKLQAIFFILALFAFQKADAQGYIDCATVYSTDAGLYNGVITKVKNGRTYLVTGGSFSSASDAPPVLGAGQSPSPSVDTYLAIYDENCNQVVGTYIGGNDSDGVEDVLVGDDGSVCILGYSESTDFPTTDGTTNPTGDDYIYIQKYDVNGTLLYSTVYGPARMSEGTIKKEGDNIFVSAKVFTFSSTPPVPTTDGTDGGGGTNNNLIFKIDASGNVVYASMIGGDGNENSPESVIVNGCQFVYANSISTDFPTTDGSIGSGTFPYLLKYDASGNVVFSTASGGSGTELIAAIESDGAYIYVTGETLSSDFPTTDGSTFSGSRDIYVQKYDLLGNLIHSSLIGGTDSDEPYDLQIANGKLYILGSTNSADFPTTDGTTVTGYYTSITKLDAATGAIEYNTVYGGSGNPDFPTMYINDAGEIFISVGEIDPYTTDGSSGFTGELSPTFVKFNTDGSLCAASVLPSIYAYYNPLCFEVDGDTMRVSHYNGYGLLNISTDGTVGAYYDEIVLTKFVFCPTPSSPPVDTLSPSTQMACRNGILSIIEGVEIVIDGSTFPTIYTEGVPGSQPDVMLDYQWQSSTSLAGPYTDIAGPLAQLTDYSPPPTTVDVYYRRVTKTAECCGGTVVSISDTSAVIVSTDFAPTVELPSLAVICPNVGITYSPIITGGIPTYSYLWNTGQTDSTIMVAPTSVSIYGVTVTDGNGCQQVAQAPVQTYSADAGSDASVCDGAATTIGGAPLAGVVVVLVGAPVLGDYSIAYTWSPATGLSCTDCPKPTALPGSDETYTLTVTLYQPDGTPCTTTDMVNVTLIAPPNLANFAGKDTVICNGEMAILGYTPEVFNTYNIVSGIASSGGTITAADFSDGNFTTGIKTDDGALENVVLDMGSVVTVNQLLMAINNFSQSWDSDFYIEASADGTNWVTLFTDVRTTSSATTTVSATSTTLLTFPDQRVRYFRFTSELTSRDVGISEFQARWGFNYIWAPGEFLTTNESEATFDAGFVLDDDLLLLDPNPYTYTLSASIGTCNFIDQVSVVMIEARAGEDGKGPRYLGEPDRTPNVEETYTWVRLDAQSTADTLSDFLGATNIPLPPVSASYGGETHFKLTTAYTFSGVTTMCMDTVIVPEYCGCDIEFEKENGCPDVSLYGPTQITATLSPAAGLDAADFDVSWSPAVGLDVYDELTVTVLEDVDRTYTVTFVNKTDPSLICVETVRVNDPAYSAPSINLVSSVLTCPNTPVNLMGSPGNPALDYVWNPIAGLDLTNPNDPIATIGVTTTYIVTVSDPSLVGGCVATDTVIVSVRGGADAGPDIYLCDNAQVSIGTPAVSGYTYSWEPTDMGQYRNSTTPTDAQPEVFVAATQQYILTTTETESGCEAMDTIDIFVSAIPPQPVLTDNDFCPSETGPFILGLDNLDGTGTNNVPTGAFTYSWTPARFLDDATLQNPTLTSVPISATTFTLKLLGGGGCNSIATLTITPTVDVPVTVSNQTICLEEAITIGSDGNTTAGGITYNWVADGSNPAGGMLSDATAPNPVFSTTETGTFIYTVTNQDLSGCTNSKSVTITVTELDLGPISGAAICLGESVQIGPEPILGVNYQWSPGTGLSDSLIANPIFSGTSANTYTLTAVNGLGCIAVLEIPVSVSINPAPDVTLPDTTLCDANATSLVINAQVNSAGDFAYQWSPSLYLDNPNILNPTFTIPGEGSYEYVLEVIDQTTGCSAFDTTTLTAIFFTPNPIVSTNADTLCLGENANLSVAVSESNLLYQWQSSTADCNTGFVNIVGAESSAYTAMAFTQKTYFRVIVSDDTGQCLDTSNCVVVVTEKCCPILDITANQQSCTDNTDGTFTANYDIEVKWNTGTFLPSEMLSVTHNGLSIGTLDPNTQTSPQTISLNVAADGTGTQAFKVAFTLDDCSADSILFKTPTPCPADITSCSGTSGCLGGNVFEDFNCNGADDTNEPGVQGIEVQIYDCNNALVGTAYSDSDGDWQVCSLTDGTAYRVEFVLPESVSCWATPTHVAGGGNQSEVQFLTAPACTKFSVSSPADYCEENPRVLIPCYINGDGSGGQDALISIAYQDQLPISDLATNIDDVVAKNIIAASNEIGSVWGLAFQRETNTLFGATHFRGHTAIGPEGMDAIYLVDPIGNSVTGHFNLSDFGAYSGSMTDPRSYTLPADPAAFFEDPLARSLAGKTSLGDIELSADGKTLYVVNLHDKTLVRFDVSNPSAPSLIGTPLPIPTDGCTATPPSYKVNMGILTANSATSTISGWEDGLNSAYTNKSTNYIEEQWNGDYSFDVTGAITNNTDISSSEEAVLLRNHSDANSINLRFPVMPNQAYIVDLYIMASSANTFDINIENTTVAAGYTTVANVGEQETYTLTPTDGILNIDLNQISGSAVLNAVKITPVNGSANNDTNSVRPFALSQNEGKIYIGTVCSGEQGQNTVDLTATVYELNESSESFISTFSMPLDYNRGETNQYDGFLEDEYIKGDWKGWQDEYFYNPPNTSMHWSSVGTSLKYYPQPLLADIDFTANGSLVLSFIDRSSLQSGIGALPDLDNNIIFPLIAGDVLRVCKVNGAYILEGEAGCNQNFAANIDPTVSGPGAAGGEFYDDIGPDDYREDNVSGLLLSKTHNQLLHYALWHPEDGLNGSGGSFRLMWLGAETGVQEGHVEIFDNNASGSNSVKGAALGDIELLCAPAPLEIGNYVWCDSLNNGIQDACERGINNILVSLYDRTGVLVGQDTTSNSGQYYFNQNNVDTTGITVNGSGIASPVTAWSGMSYATQYFIVFGGGQFATDEFIVGSDTYGITSLTNAGSNDNIDSDVDGSSLTAGSLGARPDGLPFIDMMTSATGCGDHKYDLGVTCACPIIQTLLQDTICGGVPYIFNEANLTASGTYRDTLSASNGCDSFLVLNFVVQSCDWGDLPDTSATTNRADYQTSSTNIGPVHVIIPGLSLGSTVDGEPDGQPSIDGLGDGADEDGLAIFSTLNISPGGIFRLPLGYTNTTGNPVHIEAWIDWNANGEFDAGEMVLDVTDSSLSADTYDRLEVAVPTDAVTGEYLGLRIRISHQDNMTPYGKIDSGEIEDYLIGLDCKQQICIPINVIINRE